MLHKFPHYTHLVFSGGGCSALLYIGVYRFLQQYHLMEHVHYISGTSMGAALGFLIGLGLECEYLENIFVGKDNFFEDEEMIKYDPKCLLQIPSKHGAYTMCKIEKHLKKALYHKYKLEDITFAEYVKRTGVDLHINATCLNTFSQTDLCTQYVPEMSVFTAIYASMSIPIIFEPVEYKGNLYIDGGTCNNIPVDWIVPSPATKVLAFSISTDIQFTKEELKSNMGSYISSIFLAMISSHNKRRYHEYKDIYDILEINQSPVPFMLIQFEKEGIFTRFPKEIIEEGILFGYHQMHELFVSKGYFEQIEQDH
jgi:NTE family protein